MSKYMTFIILTLFIGLLCACQSTPGSAETEQVQQQLDDIEARLDGLESRLEEQAGSASHDMGASDQVFQVTIAAYLLDTAGFHDLDERINGEGVIMPGDAGTVNRVNGALAATDWPDELQAGADQLMGVLTDYAEALANDDLEAAKPLASTAHEAQHDLSHSIENWLGRGTGDEHDMEHSEHDGDGG